MNLRSTQCLITAAWKSPISALMPSICCGTEIAQGLSPIPLRALMPPAPPGLTAKVPTLCILSG